MSKKKKTTKKVTKGGIAESHTADVTDFTEVTGTPEETTTEEKKPGLPQSEVDENKEEKRGVKPAILTLEDVHNAMNRAIITVNQYAEQVEKNGKSSDRFRFASRQLNGLLRNTLIP